MAATANGTAAKKPRPKPSHPTYLEMAKEAIVSLGDKKGASVPALQSYIAGKYNIDIETVRVHLKPALAKGLETGALVRPKNSEASGYQGRFKVDKSKNAEEEKAKKLKEKEKLKKEKEKLKKEKAKEKTEKSIVKKKSTTGKSPVKKKAADKPKTKPAAKKSPKKTEKKIAEKKPKAAKSMLKTPKKTPKTLKTAKKAKVATSAKK